VLGSLVFGVPASIAYSSAVAYTAIAIYTLATYILAITFPVFLFVYFASAFRAFVVVAVREMTFIAIPFVIHVVSATLAFSTVTAFLVGIDVWSITVVDVFFIVQDTLLSVTRHRSYVFLCLFVDVIRYVEKTFQFFLKCFESADLELFYHLI